MRVAERTIVRLADISDPNNPVVCGSGFVIADDRIMTCAHVIDDCCGIERGSSEPAPSGNIGVELIFFSPPGAPRWFRAKVVEDGWHPMFAAARNREFEDIAVLRFVDQMDFMLESAPFASADSNGLDLDQRVWCHGVISEDQGVAGEPVLGKIVGSPGPPFSSFRTDRDDVVVRGGFSGAAVWHVPSETVIGMIAMAREDAETNRVRFLPSAYLQSAWSPPKKRDARSDKTLIEDKLMCFVNRSYPAFDFKDAAAEIDIRTPRPLIYMFHGPRVEEHESFADRLSLHEVPEVLNTGRVEATRELGIIMCRRNPDAEFVRGFLPTIGRELSLVSNAEVTATEVARALNQPTNPFSYFYELPADNMPDESLHVALLERLMAFWREVFQRPLQRQIVLYLGVVTDKEGAEGDALIERYFELVKAMLTEGDAAPEILLRRGEYPLESILEYDVTEWINHWVEPNVALDSRELRQLELGARELFLNTDKLSMKEFSSKMKDILAL